MTKQRKDYWFEIIDTTDGSVYARRFYVEASNVKEAREILVEHFRNTEYKVGKRTTEQTK